MALQVGSRLGHYDVTALIGEGGMGQVYQATDTKLNRQVALKILPEAFASDPDRLARFQREAQVLASLNHPGIAAIYGLEEEGDTRALVLELVEGPTLADRIAQGPIPIDEALPIAKQIAEALEAAHEAGVIHRDLKPANIKVKDDGTVKVLDFGLAKALETSPEGDPSQSPTLTAAATQMGVIMGTAAYMSPEQASGETAGKRSDIWSFGVVLFEMLTGQRLFTGKTLSHVLAKVLERDLDLTVLPATTPAPVRRLLRRCLERDQKRRLRDAGEAVAHLEEAATAPADDSTVVAPVAQPAGWRQALRPTLTMLFASLITGLVVWAVTRPPVALMNQLAVVVPDGLEVSSPLLSRDGRTVVFEGFDGAQSQVYVRPLDQREAVSLRGAEGFPSGFSPDGERILFGVPGGTLRYVSAAGGSVTTVAEGAGGAAWGPDETVVFGGNRGLWLVPADLGDPTPLLPLGEGEIGHLRPRFLPDGRAVLFYVDTGVSDTRQVAVYDFAAEERRMLVTGTSPEFMPPGHLVFWRDSALWAVPFDLDALEVSGNPRPVLGGVLANLNGWAHYAIGPDGTLLYVPGTEQSDQRSLVWVSRDGVEEAIAMTPRDYSAPTLSPDGTQLVVSVGDILEGGNLYRYNLETGVEEQVTFSGMDLRPKWSPDGSQIAFSSRRGGVENVYIMAADGTGTLTPLADSPIVQSVNAWLPDGTGLLVGEMDPTTGVDISILRMGSGEPTEKLIQTDASEYNPAVSPNSRWMAYRAGTITPDVWVVPFPDVDSRQPRLIGPGMDPLWGSDGRELFYRGRDSVMVVEVETGETFERGEPRPLFPDVYYNVNAQNWVYDPNSDRFVMIRDTSADEQPDPNIAFVQNWGEEVKRLVPVP
jgi:hypothetical protein